jgi:hypothetical protein
MARLIRKTSRQNRTETSELLQSVFALELIAPSDKFWLISPWISDIPIIDNRGGTFSIDPKWGPTRISLSKVLVAMAARGTEVIIVTTTDRSNDSFLGSIKAEGLRQGVMSRIQIEIDDDENLHEKAITSSDYLIDGSMNFTFTGLFIRRERIKFDIDQQMVAETRVGLVRDFQ